MSRTREDAGTLRPLLDNHLAFLATHRGKVTFRDDAVDIVGDEDFLSCWIPTAAEAQLPAAAHAVRTVPWSGPGWPERLRAEGFAPAEVLLYMEMSPRLDVPAGAPVTVIEVDSPADALAFAAAQGGGFLDPDDPRYGWWQDTFERMALRNYPDPDQCFYLVRAEGIPAAVTLVLRTGTVFGVYAVATRPEFRGRGYASALLARARLDALDRGAERFTLQVFEGSPAERLYRGLGFTPAFRSPAYRR